MARCRKTVKKQGMPHIAWAIRCTHQMQRKKTPALPGMGMRAPQCSILDFLQHMLYKVTHETDRMPEVYIKSRRTFSCEEGAVERATMQRRIFILPSEQLATTGSGSINNLPVQLTSFIGREQQV